MRATASRQMCSQDICSLWVGSVSRRLRTADVKRSAAPLPRAGCLTAIKAEREHRPDTGSHRKPARDPMKVAACRCRRPRFRMHLPLALALLGATAGAGRAGPWARDALRLAGPGCTPQDARRAGRIGRPGAGPFARRSRGLGRLGYGGHRPGVEGALQSGVRLRPGHGHLVVRRPDVGPGSPRRADHALRPPRPRPASTLAAKSARDTMVSGPASIAPNCAQAVSSGSAVQRNGIRLP